MLIIDIIMVKYIIKINCTGKKDLTFNGIAIRVAKKNLHQSPPDITLGYISCIFPYIKELKIVYKKFDKIVYKKFDKIVYKKFDKITIKRLEFYCENETDLSDEDFIHLIEVLKRLGFASENDVKISYCKIDKIDKYINGNNVMREKHEEILAYTFTSLVKIVRVKRKNRKRKPERSIYTTKLLYVCKNLVV
jgi:hypothetical protein